ncbi:MAG: GtrA family protein [Minisyncoccota bacterium]
MRQLIDRKGVLRFMRYGSVGLGTFLIDLALLFLFTDVFHLHYLLATGVAFGVAVSLNYVISRRLVFRKTGQTFTKGYANFLVFASAGMALSMVGMYFLVSLVGFSYLIARIMVAGFVGLWNYAMNLYVNFQTAGKH